MIKFIPILVFTLCCGHVTCAINPNVLSGILASHMIEDNSTTSVNATHVIITRIEEKLANGCYRQTIQETRSDNSNKTVETWVWICPAGTPRESILELECNCSEKCHCPTEHDSTTTTTTIKPVSVENHNIKKVVKITIDTHSKVNHTSTPLEHSIVHNATDEYVVLSPNISLSHNVTEETRPEVNHHATSAANSLLHATLFVTLISILI